MAIGDKASAKGLAVYASTQDRRKGFENDNQRGDELADEMTARAANDALKVDKSMIVVSNTEPATKITGMLWFADA